MKLLTKGNIYKNFLLFAIPLVISNLLGQAASLIDTIIAGKFLGENGIAAIGSTALFITFFHGAHWGIEAGGSSYISRNFAKRNNKELKSRIYSFIVFMTTLFLIICIAICLLAKPILTLLRVDAEIFNDALIYFIIVMASMFFYVFGSTNLHILQALGISKYPFIVSLTTTIINITGNLLSVTVFNLGVFGLALSTALSYLVMAIMYLFKMKKIFKELSDDKPVFSMHYIKSLLSYGIPATIQQLALYSTGVFVSPLINALGIVKTAAYSIAEKIYSACACLFQASNKSLIYYSAECMGSHEYYKIKKGIRVALLQNIIFTLPVFLIFFIFPEQVCSIFFINKTGEALPYTIFFVKRFLPFIIFSLFDSLFHGLMRGVKNNTFLLALSIWGAIVRITASFILIPIYDLTGAFIAMGLSWILESILALIMYLTNLWIPRDKREAFKAAPTN